MEFQYVGYTLEQGIVRGRVEADNEAIAGQKVIQQGYKILEMKVARQLPALEDMFPSLFKLSQKELVRFTQQLAIMVRGGGSLQRALELLAAETQNRVLRRVLNSIIKSVDEGTTLSAAMQMHPKVFTARFFSVVGAGEHTGRLAPALEQLAKVMEREQEARDTVKRTMMMPMFTIGAAGLMLVMMLTVLMPPLLTTFERMGSDIPLITRIAMGGMGVITSNLKGVGLAIGGLIGLVLLSKKVDALDYWKNAIVIRTPILGQLILAGELALFSRTISMLLDSGISLANALPLAIAGTKNLVVRDAFRAGEESLIAGRGLSDALKEHSILPTMWVELVMIGEESNTLGLTMAELGNAYQKELENRLGSLLALLEPLSTMAVGGIVLFIALSMFLPIYSGLDAAAGLS
jgi:type II secretory pathway component PulF